MNTTFSIIYFLALIVIFYLLIIRPQQQRAKQHAELVESLVAGDRIITNGGIYGTVIAIEEKTSIIRVAENVEIRVLRQSIAARQADAIVE